MEAKLSMHLVKLLRQYLLQLHLNLLLLRIATIMRALLMASVCFRRLRQTQLQILALFLGEQWFSITTEE